MSEEQKSAVDCPTFEEALENLEAIVHDLEEGQIGLAQALERYEAGVKLLKQCYELLEGAERRIELLSGFDTAGNPVVAPFDDESSQSRNEKGQVRSRRRSASRSEEAGSDVSTNVDSPGTLF